MEPVMSAVVLRLLAGVLVVVEIVVVAVLWAAEDLVATAEALPTSLQT